MSTWNSLMLCWLCSHIPNVHTLRALKCGECLAFVVPTGTFHRIVWVGKDLLRSSSPTALQWTHTGTHTARPGCSEPNPTWPWVSSHVSEQPIPMFFHLHHKRLFPYIHSKSPFFYFQIMLSCFFYLVSLRVPILIRFPLAVGLL